MDSTVGFAEIIELYYTHGWQLRRVLLRPETRRALGAMLRAEFPEALIVDAPVDALWFARPSYANREAWELRLVTDSPYALFETFAADQPEAERERARGEMEARLIEKASSANWNEH
jgi:hypothetical protein